MKTTASAALAIVFLSSAAASANSHYASMAPIEKYLMPTASAEVALARTAAPASVSAHAQVLVLTKTGYVVGAKGSNGWVCFVERMWTAGLDDPEFWNPKGRAPNCFNPPAVRSVLPQYVARTNWAIAGNTRDQIAKKAQDAYATHQFTNPAPGAFSFMLSKDAYLNDATAGPWRPHVMLFIASDQMATWAAGFDGSPVIAPPPNIRAYEPMTIFIPVRHWSDGSPAPK
jgi:hypothetical protein